MTEVEKEKALDLYPLPVTIEGTNIILEQMKKCICKIENKNGNGTGFLCYIPYKNKKLEVMMTNNHIINEDIIKNNKSIEISLNDNKEKKIINIEKRKIYTSIKYDTTIIPINSEEDKINNFLEIDEEIFNNNIYNKSIYILQYPRINLGEQKASVSYGILKNIQDEYNIIHYCYTEHGSSGSPILNLLNKKIIGIHKESVKKYNYNRGTYLKYPIIEYINNIYLNKKGNEINMIIKIEKEDINKDKYFLDNNDDKGYNKGGINFEENHHDKLKELNESNTKIYIAEEEGKYKTKLKFNKPDNKIYFNDNKNKNSSEIKIKGEYIPSDYNFKFFKPNDKGVIKNIKRSKIPFEVNLDTIYLIERRKGIEYPEDYLNGPYYPEQNLLIIVDDKNKDVTKIVKKLKDEKFMKKNPNK